MAEQKATNIVWHEGEVTAEERNKNLGQKGCTLWMTGLSGSGKSTVAVALEQVLFRSGQPQGLQLRAAVGLLLLL